MIQQMLPQINSAKQILNAIRMSNNPQALIQQVLASNPQFKQVEQLINGSNGSIEQAVYSLCSQKGINPQEFLDALK